MIKLEINAVPAKVIGSTLASLIRQHGSREGIKQVGNKFCGLEVVWDSDEFKVE
ncbi:MAG: hypothetical protein SCARUB_00520 [Candidatus Scalindua rubra]|uniref:Uncharacterized protein n=1 Tax=Candidatus Scalindua rubra TaxID=1872076 RepID=A0A1E3XFM6_9BACT|nr:MAG: hypothetical protein SCARUB_00520 [Candidatus Scalindua rubra]